MSKEIEEFIEYLKQEVKKTQIYYHLPIIERFRNFNNNFKVKLYDVEKYDCEMATLWSGNKEAIDIFKKVFADGVAHRFIPPCVSVCISIAGQKHIVRLLWKKDSAQDSRVFSVSNKFSRRAAVSFSALDKFRKI